MAAPCDFELDDDANELGGTSVAFPGEEEVLEGESTDAVPSVLMSVVESDFEALVPVVVLIFEYGIVDINVRVDVTVGVELGGDELLVAAAQYPTYSHCESSGQQRTPHGV